MWPSSTLLLPFLALRLAVADAQALSTVTYGPGGLCPAPSTTSVVVVQQAVYSSFFQSASQINNIFGDGNTIMINNAPTTYITTSYITTTIVTTVMTTTVSPTAPMSSSTSATSSVAAGPITQTTSAAPGSSSTPMFSTMSTTGSSAGGTSGPTTTQRQTFAPVAPPAATTTTPPVLTITTTDANGNTITVTTTQPTFTLGEGLPTGTVSDIPATSPVMLGFSFGGAGAKVKREALNRQEMKRQGSTLDNPPPQGLLQGQSGEAGNNCGFATRYYLVGGMLMSGNESVGRNLSDIFVVITPEPYYNDVNTTFFFANGVLGWNTTDQGAATFYQCGDGLIYAGFPNPTQDNCYPITIGGIAAAACPADFTNDPVPPPDTSSSTASTTTTVEQGTSTTEISTTIQPTLDSTTTPVSSTPTDVSSSDSSSPSSETTPPSTAPASSPSTSPSPNGPVSTSQTTVAAPGSTSATTGVTTVTVAPTTVVSPSVSTTLPSVPVSSTSPLASPTTTPGVSTSSPSASSAGVVSVVTTSTALVGASSTMSSSGSQTSPASSQPGTSSGPAGGSSTTSVVGQSSSSTTSPSSSTTHSIFSGWNFVSIIDDLSLPNRSKHEFGGHNYSKHPAAIILFCVQYNSPKLFHCTLTILNYFFVPIGYHIYQWCTRVDHDQYVTSYNYSEPGDKLNRSDHEYINTGHDFLRLNHNNFLCSASFHQFERRYELEHYFDGDTDNY
ncbi:hypothetical protein PV05_01642 [Exophiala xenobiotica]|uniref:DUF7908 domain-containing protein n=1 Tax=Exophiala xenobiotica TaxID=348802 RepID=A0A0D2C9D1_9EURO|nr:uncharacterized protein PV05_01642 [Exophiala xenobiotica]KIW61531.1 hypothetical protein PV05_01642 [Exophiala xenobiotica]